MSVDPKLAEALAQAVADADQPHALARKLNAWLTSVTSGNEDINDIAAADRHLELIYQEVQLQGDGKPDGADEHIGED